MGQKTCLAVYILLINVKNTRKFPFISYHCFSLSYSRGYFSGNHSGQILANCVLQYRNVSLDALQQAILGAWCNRARTFKCLWGLGIDAKE
jgi:hypothetical protein